MSQAEHIQLFFARTLQAVLAGELLAALLGASWWVALITSLALLASFLPAILAHNTRLHAPAGFQLVITLFIFATFLGEAADFYWRFWWWDKVLHATSGMILGLVGFLVLFTLFDHDRVRMHPILLSVFAVAFAMAIGTLWEIFEYIVDNSVGTSMQRANLSDTSGLDDTMMDHILNGLGAIAAVAAAHTQVTRHRGRRWLKDLAAQFVDAEAAPPVLEPRRQGKRRAAFPRSAERDA